MITYDVFDFDQVSANRVRLIEVLLERLRDVTAAYDHRDEDAERMRAALERMRAALAVACCPLCGCRGTRGLVDVNDPRLGLINGDCPDVFHDLFRKAMP